jgi:hypothetical protein
MPRSKSIDDRILPLIQYDFPGTGMRLRMEFTVWQPFIGELRDFDDLIGWRGGLDVNKIAEPSRGL